MAAHPSAWGTRLGPRVAMLVSQAIIYTHAKLVHVKHKLAMAVFHAISDEISDEVDVTLGPLLKRMHDEIPEDHPAYPGIHFMHTASGQLKALAGTGLQISGLLGSISAIMNNELADIVYNVIRANPALLPDAGTIVQAYNTGKVSRAEGQAALAAQGIQYAWGGYMLDMGFSYPSLADGLELMRRGIATRDQFAEWMGFNGVPEYVVAYYLSLVNNPLSAADAALAVLRGAITQAEGVKIAADNGLTPSQFEVLIANTGEPPGLQQMLEGYRRGFIDEATLRRGILQSRYRDEWIPLLERLRFEPMSVADAVNAVVQNHLSSAEGNAIAEQNGLEPGAFQVLQETAGEPLSRTEMEELYNRGLATRADVEQALRESRLKDKYLDKAFDLHAKVLPIYTLQHAIRFGTISQAEAVCIAMESGYSKADATTIVSAGAAQQLESAKNSTLTAIRSLLEDGIMSPPDAESAIEGLGFSKEQAAFEVKSSAFHRQAKLVSTTVAGIRSKYLNHHITRNAAVGLLDKLAIPAANRDYILNIWDIELQSYIRNLTEAQVAKAVKLQLITLDDGLARLVQMGYAKTDAELLLAGA